MVGGKDRLGKEKLSVFILGDYTKQFETATVGVSAFTINYLMQILMTTSDELKRLQ